MKKLIKDNYNSIVKRGLITPSTTHYDFYQKLKEEVQEVEDSKTKDEMKEEIADVILVCLNWAKHYNYDIETELKNKIEKNWRRCEKT
jgi:NTP pyrophosphatase (non-canonical NTP hydrolase)